VLLQEIGERLVGEFLERRHAVAGEQVEHDPGLVVDLNALAGHALETLVGRPNGRREGAVDYGW
jgi:hypothetical protein